MIHEILIGEHQGLEPILTHQREKPFGSDFRRLDLRFWRLHRIFKERDLPMTVYACALALERNPPAAHAIKEVGYDICCHGWCWIEHFRLDEATEREHIRMAVESSEAYCWAASVRLVLPLWAERQHATPHDGGRRLSLRQRQLRR